MLSVGVQVFNSPIFIKTPFLSFATSWTLEIEMFVRTGSIDGNHNMIEGNLKVLIAWVDVHFGTK